MKNEEKTKRMGTNREKKRSLELRKGRRTVNKSKMNKRKMSTKELTRVQLENSIPQSEK
jgi:hypothetical protein